MNEFASISPLPKQRDPMRPRFGEITHIKRETHDCFTWHIRTCEVDAFRPGQFNMLYVFGVGEVPISLSGDPDVTQEAVHTIRSLGSVTQRMAQFSVGDQVGVRGPFGTSWPLLGAQAKDVVIVAGGIGLAPLRPVIYSVLKRRTQFRHVYLLYGARTPQDLLYSEEFSTWAQGLTRVEVTVDRSDASWSGSVGVVTGLIPRLDLEPSQTIAMLCGPEVMIRFTVRELAKRNIPTDKIFVSLERNMKCAVGSCGHCQMGPYFVCKDGPVFSQDRIDSLIGTPEL